MVNPGGTGTPRLVISARLAPLPPRTCFMPRVPSAAPAPKKYTDFSAVVSGVSAAAAEAELVWVGGRRGGVVTGEACVAEAVRTIRNGVQHPVERQVAERINSAMLPDLFLVKVGGDEFLARRR